MNIKKIETFLALFVLAFTLFAIPTGVTGHESVRERYPAHVMAQGNLTLTGDPGTFEIIDIQANFTAMVPIQLAHNGYDALFSGKAHVTEQNIFFRGDLYVSVNAEEHEFHVSFTVPNTFGIPASGEYEHEYSQGMESGELEASFTYEPTEICANDLVTFDASESTANGGEIISYEWDFGDDSTDSGMIVNHTYMLAETYIVTLNATDSEGLWAVESEEIHVCDQRVEPAEPEEHEPKEEYEATGEFEITIGPVSAPLPIEKTWVKIKGLVTSFDEQPAFGWLKAHAKLGEWAKVRAFWTTTNLALNVEDLKGNDDHSAISFTYSFYAAVLANATVVELDYSGSDFYISGLWNVYNISWTYHSEEDFTFTVESLAEDRAGELNVTGGWREFTLDITDIGVASGQVVFLLHRSFVIPRGDVNDDYIVDVWDLVHIAKRYGTRPGKPDFDFDIDFDDDFEVGLGELTTIAANLGTEY
jgi:PKD repeat protein